MERRGEFRCRWVWIRTYVVWKDRCWGCVEVKVTGSHPRQLWREVVWGLLGSFIDAIIQQGLLFYVRSCSLKKKKKSKNFEIPWGCYLWEMDFVWFSLPKIPSHLKGDPSPPLIIDILLLIPPSFQQALMLGALFFFISAVLRIDRPGR